MFSRSPQSWKKRWVILDESGALRYYKVSTYAQCNQCPRPDHLGDVIANTLRPRLDALPAHPSRHHSAQVRAYNFIDWCLCVVHAGIIKACNISSHHHLAINLHIIRDVIAVLSYVEAGSWPWPSNTLPSDTFALQVCNKARLSPFSIQCTRLCEMIL